MATAAKKGESAAAPEKVLVPFAYPTTVDGEVVQLVQGDTIDGARFTKKSVEHLRAIGFIGAQD